MNKKSILSLTLVCSLLASNVSQGFFWSSPAPISVFAKLTTLAKSGIVKTIKTTMRNVRGASKSWRKFDKIFPKITTALVGILIYRLFKIPLNNGWNAIVKKSPNWFQKVFAEDGKKDLEKENGLGILDVETNFSNPEHFAPGSIDKNILSLITQIRKNRLNEEEIEIPRLILLHGDSQIGKTHSAKGLANELGAKKHRAFSLSQVVSMYQGKSQANLWNMYLEAKKIATKEEPFVFIFDEIDGLFNKRESNSTNRTGDKVLHVFHRIADEIEEKKLPIYIISMTNFYSKLPKTAKTRFDNGTFEVSLPNAAARRAILKQECENLNVKCTDSWLTRHTQKSKGLHIKAIKGMARKDKLKKQPKINLHHLHIGNKNGENIKDINEILKEKKKKNRYKKIAYKIKRWLKLEKEKPKKKKIITLDYNEKFEQFKKETLKKLKIKKSKKAKIINNKDFISFEEFKKSMKEKLNAKRSKTSNNQTAFPFSDDRHLLKKKKQPNKNKFLHDLDLLSKDKEKEEIDKIIKRLKGKNNSSKNRNSDPFLNDKKIVKEEVNNIFTKLMELENTNIKTSVNNQEEITEEEVMILEKKQ